MVASTLLSFTSWESLMLEAVSVQQRPPTLWRQPKMFASAVRLSIWCDCQDVARG